MSHAALVAAAVEQSRFRDPLDFAQLNQAELRVLRLLGEGHTAKSIANALGSTEAAVNERLREARRKTGVGSSRELARLLKSQENRHKQIGMADEQATRATACFPDASSWHSRTGVIVMITLVISAVAAATIMQVPDAKPGTQAQPGMIADADLGTFVQVGPAWLYPMIRRSRAMKAGRMVRNGS